MPPTALASAPSNFRAEASRDEWSRASQVEPRVDASETSSSVGGEKEFPVASAPPPPPPPFLIPESLTRTVSAPRVAERGTGSEAADSKRVERAVQRSCGVGSPSGGFFFFFFFFFFRSEKGERAEEKKEKKNPRKKKNYRKKLTSCLHACQSDVRITGSESPPEYCWTSVSRWSATQAQPGAGARRELLLFCCCWFCEVGCVAVVAAAAAAAVAVGIAPAPSPTSATCALASSRAAAASASAASLSRNLSPESTASKKPRRAEPPR